MGSRIAPLPILALAVLTACASDPADPNAELLLADAPFCTVVGERVRCRRDCTIEVPGREAATEAERFACAWECDMPADATMADAKALELW